MTADCGSGPGRTKIRKKHRVIKRRGEGYIRSENTKEKQAAARRTTIGTDGKRDFKSEQGMKPETGRKKDRHKQIQFLCLGLALPPAAL